MNLVEEGIMSPALDRIVGAQPEACPAVVWSVEGAVLSVVLTGAIDASLYPRLGLLLSASSARFERADIDLEQVTFFGAAGLNLLAQLASGARVTLLGVPERSPIRRAVHAVGLDLLISYQGAGGEAWSAESAA